MRIVKAQYTLGQTRGDAGKAKRLPHMLVLIKRQTLAQFDQIVEYVFEAERIKVGHERRCAERQLGYIFRNIGRLKADTSTTASMVDLAIIHNFATDDKRYTEWISHGLSHIVRIGRKRGNTIIRSEEHTSELQSLMRTSYAVLCLK